ncbi:hypothetical protein GH714_004868 [Hevea brasiliensis]|uniref:Uncharacterized protein n=1 Tax=Hevea brasiliensis TaxID=3981 RepID=A0A6A6MBE1_HEVBR|nr:hypothetical protein GH714_004850 [Hevea brasiliensis]KAF2309736.1 hypothetical protein GH714_004868 [Hevea brasiliensis]
MLSAIRVKEIKSMLWKLADKPDQTVDMRTLFYELTLNCFEWVRISEEIVDMREGAGVTVFKAQSLHAKCRARPVMVNLLS